MHINNPDALKTWLTEVLEPLCDADPAALARYVLALLKKDKPEKDLRDCMKEQLDVFLGQETEPFLEQLFRAIKSEEYIKVVQAKEAAAAAAAAATAAAAAAASAAAQQASAQASPATAAAAASTEQVSNSSHSNSTSSSSSSSKVRIKREFTPPLHDSKPSKDSLGVPSGATVSSSSGNSHADNADLSSSASSGAISSSAAAAPTSAVSSSAAAASNNSSKSTPPVKSSSSKDDHSKDSRSRGRRISNRSRSRSRSRSFERSRRSRSRDRNLARESNRDKSNRQYRNKSPVGRGGGGGGGGSDSFRRYDRKNHGYESSSRRGEPEKRVKSEVSEKRGTIRSQSRSRSPSPVADRRKMARSESPAVAAPAIVPAPALDHPPAVDGAMLGGKRQRCRDFDEKGYCMRGETCPWDHGVDPVVLEDINNPALITIQSAAQLRTGPIHPEYSPDAPELWNRPPNFPPGRPSITQRLGNMTGVNVGGGFGPRGALSGNFRNVAPGFPPGFPGNPIGATPLQRELISVPVVDANKGGDVSSQQTKRRFEPEDAVAIADGHLKRKLPLNNRLGPRVTGHPAGAGGAVNPQQNCSLELRKIPRGLNAIAHLNNHFSKFGKIVNIQISYDGDPEAAIVTFSTHAEANVAYRSTEAVLNNRFIKVFWHTAGSGEQPAITPAAKTEHSLRRSYPNQYSINNNLNQNANVTTAGITPTTVTPAVTKEGTPVSSSAAAVSTGGENVAPATTAVATGFTNTATKLINTVTTPIVTANQLRMKNSKINRATSELLRKKQELTQTMHKGKYDLMQGYLKELSKLIMMVEKYEATDPMRTKLLAPIKDLEAKIAALKTEISSEQNQIAATLMPKRKTKEQHEKDILDAELEIIAAEQRTHRIPGVPGGGGANPQPAVGGIPPAQIPAGGKSQHPGQRPVRPTNRLAPIGSTSVDRRPTTISITGFAAEDADALLGHFKNFGEITKHQLDKTVPSLLISYSIRQNAEKALVRGKAFRGDVTLQIGWVATTTVPTTQTPALTTTPIAPTAVIAPVGATESKDKCSSVEAVVEKDAGAKEGADADVGKVSTTLEAVGAGAGIGGGGGVGVGVDTSSAASLDALTETGSMEEASEVRMVEEEEEEEEEDRSWRR